MKRAQHNKNYRVNILFITALFMIPILSTIFSINIAIGCIKTITDSLVASATFNYYQQENYVPENDNILEQGYELENTVLKEEEEIDPYELSFSERNTSITVNRHTDLGYNNILITAEEMNKIIDYWDSKTKNGTKFTGYGQAFLDIAEATGLNPIYILAHAGVESAWGKSNMAITKNNYFGIHAYDSNPDLALTMGDSVIEGLYNGAKWIAEKYYQQGQDTLHEMIYGPKRYASAADAWINEIVSIMGTSYRVLYNNKI